MPELGVHVDNLFRLPEVYCLGENPRAGCVTFYPLNHVLTQVHVVFSPAEPRRIAIARAAVGWMFEHTRYQCVTAFAPVHRREVRAFALGCGMECVGVMKDCFQYEGNLFDQQIYQITRPGFEKRRKLWDRQ